MSTRCKWCGEEIKKISDVWVNTHQHTHMPINPEEPVEDPKMMNSKVQSHELMRNAMECQRDTLLGVQGKRSSEWCRVREKHLLKSPFCAVCGSSSLVEVHHKKPFHLFPQLELDPDNLLTLCTHGPAGMNCHCVFGHGGYWEDYIPDVVKSAANYKESLVQRVKG